MIMWNAAPEIIFPPHNELSLLGAPLLTDGLSMAISAKTATLKLMSSRIDILPAHQSFFLLKNCLVVPKVIYLLRSASVYECMNELNCPEKVICESVEAITNTARSPAVWRQASLPAAFGGIEIRRTSELALSAFLESVHATEAFTLQILPIIDIEPSLSN
ncbi:hypothetical protein BV898_05348 [Hypsibius exemplaris]|uniref:Uncharacterized protein n=1 Tax=Hypsibius exemplaris TaxID=2072580 RepID=A0A1W0WZY6_HYPEX|nr:hypothetical protein BV898_05348 [Hypsibius exemplaris]